MLPPSALFTVDSFPLEEWSVKRFNLERLESVDLEANINNQILIHYRIHLPQVEITSLKLFIALNLGADPIIRILTKFTEIFL